MVMPVGPYYTDGLSPIKAMIVRDYVRACPGGTGAYKIAGNYAASLLPSQEAKQAGYQVELYLDAQEHRYIDECGTANFFAIKDNTYITPLSDSILPSITNDSLISIAQSHGLQIQRRQIDAAELSEFQEVGACGTAAVITPLSEIYDPQSDTPHHFDDARPIIELLYKTLTDIQFGNQSDRYHRLHFVA